MRRLCGLVALALCVGVLAAFPARVAAAGPNVAAWGAGAQTGDIGTGPYIVFAISGGLMLVWLGMQVFKRRDKDD